MPNSKKVSKYPAHLFDLLNIPKHKLPITIDCGTPNQAKQQRLQLYGFTEALRHEKHPGVAILDGMLFRVSGQTLTIEDRDIGTTAFTHAIKQTLRHVHSEELAKAAPVPATPPSSEEIQSATQPAQGPASPRGAEHDKAIETYLKGGKS